MILNIVGMHMHRGLLQKRDRAAIAQLGERQTEDLKVPGSIPGRGSSFLLQSVFASSSVNPQNGEQFTAD